MKTLPPANPNAFGLHLTDTEWRRLRELLMTEPAIVRARIYGSRQAGGRRPKSEPEPLDIDLAIEVYAADPKELDSVFMFAVERLEQGGGDLRIQVEDLTEVSSDHYRDRQAGVLVLDRTSNFRGASP